MYTSFYSFFLRKREACSATWNLHSVPTEATAKSSTAVPEVEVEQTNVCLDKTQEAEDNWVQNSTLLLKKEQVEKDDAIAWAAYHASQKTNTHGLPALCAMQPLFYEKSATPAMIKHGVDVVCMYVCMTFI